MSMLRSKTPAHRAVAATGLGAINYGASGKKVMALVQDDDLGVQQAAIIAVGRLSPDGAVLTLARVAGREDLNQAGPG